MSAERQVVLVKLGGSLITDKSGIETVRPEVLRRLAAEIAEICGRDDHPRAKIILGHGSGSFGHVAASRGGWTTSAEGPALETVARTQDAAARLHREVISFLLEAGVAPFSITPGSMMLSEQGEPAVRALEPLTAALEAGLLPVTFGDVILEPGAETDAPGGGPVARIVSTETVFRSLAPLLLARGYEIAAALWLGVTDGILDSNGRPFGTLRESDMEAAFSVLAVGDAGEGVRDVTGGMRHRLEAALALARLGVPSSIIDGRPEGALARAIDGEALGTHVLPEE